MRAQWRDELRQHREEQADILRNFKSDELREEMRQQREQHTELLKSFNLLLEQLKDKKIESFDQLAKYDKDGKAAFIRLAEETEPLSMKGKNIGLFGITSTGKSTMVNSLLGKAVAEVGVGETTTEIQRYAGINYVLWDFPGNNDEVNYLSMEYIAIFKGLTKRIILIQATVKENSSIMRILDELQLQYDIVFNKFDKVIKEERESIKRKIHNEIKDLGLKKVGRVFFVSSTNIKMFSDWLDMVHHLTD